MQPRRIVIDFLAASTGGQLTRARAFLARLRRFDANSEVWLLQENGALGACAQRADFNVVNLASAPGRLRALRRMAWQNLRLPALIKRHRIDTYISFSHYLPWTLPGGVTSVVGVSNLAPFSQAALDAETMLWPRLRLHALRRTILSAARRADSVIALSETCRAVLTDSGITPAKIHVIPNGVEITRADTSAERLAALRNRYPVPARYLLYVSHFYPYKNFVRLVAAYAQLPPGLRADFALVLVGVPHDRSYYNAVQSEIKRRGLTAQILTIAGLTSEELAPLYAHASLFVFPSLVENCPNSLLEAMAYGAPVLAGKHAPMHEFGADAVRYFDAYSSASMTREITAALADEPALNRMRELARARAARYSWDEFTARVVSLYLDEPVPSLHADQSKSRPEFRARESS
jgi:glycosyltransferase involved in cell wall biosynthesis